MGYVGLPARHPALRFLLDLRRLADSRGMAGRSVQSELGARGWVPRMVRRHRLHGIGARIRNPVGHAPAPRRRRSRHLPRQLENLHRVPRGKRSRTRERRCWSPPSAGARPSEPSAADFSWRTSAGARPSWPSAWQACSGCRHGCGGSRDAEYTSRRSNLPRICPASPPFSGCGLSGVRLSAISARITSSICS